MFTSKSTDQIFQEHMKRTDPLLIRIQCDTARDYKLLRNFHKKTWITTLLIIIIVIVMVLLI
jgi:hypothetical protein